MGVFKSIGYVVGGIAVGVGTIVALPIAGPIGAITAIGALIAGGTGGVAGGIFSSTDDSEEKAKQDGFKKGKQYAKSENTERMNQLLNNLKKQEDKFKEQKDFEDFTIAAFAVGISVANCDGELHPDEISDLEEIISGESYKSLPISLKNEIRKLKNNPPTFNTAMEFVKKVNKNKWESFSDIIELVMNADGHIRREENAYFEAWNRFKNAA
jgi:uncharacterized tellurite resistance protein B-like protein